MTAILAETSPRLRAQSAAITLRIWHHLASEDARLLLFEPFRREGRSLPLIDAVLLAAADRGAPFSLHLDAAQIRGGQVALGDAFAEALADIYGDAAQDLMIPAWRRVLDHLLDRIAARLEQRPA